MTSWKLRFFRESMAGTLRVLYPSERSKVTWAGSFKFNCKCWFTGRIIHLPDCHLPNDSRLLIVDHAPARETGLPENGFVFACFNNAHKCSHETFALWTRLVRAVDASVLWLPESSIAAIRNLRNQAQTEGIPRERMPTKLATPRTIYALFDTRRFTRKLEAAFITMCERYQRGLAPESFAVP
jgi:predicted O-linked N-acetylglucosamine transferase (SPINDLY family)